MPFSNYTELRAAVAGFLNRTDLTDAIPDFIVLAEANIRRKLRRAFHSKVTATGITGDHSLAATMESVTGVALNDGAGGTHNHPLELLTFEDYHALLSVNPAVRAPTQGVYVEHNVSDGSTILRFYPPVSVSSPIAALVIEGTLALPALVTTGSNALLRDAPDIYLYATLLEAAPYLEHDERIPVWEKRLEQGLREYEVQIERRRFDGAPRRMKLPVVF